MAELACKVTLLKSSNVIDSEAIFEIEDGFRDLYITDKGGTVIKPPYSFSVLARVVEENNALEPCISAYEVNIDGSGWVLLLDGEQVEESDLDSLGTEILGFLNEVDFGLSFTTFRRKVRKRLEIYGNAFVEVVRNLAGAIILLRVLPTETMRICSLGPSKMVTRYIFRAGKKIPVTMSVRERSFVQLKGNSEFRYFKEFQASRDINKFTGEWSDSKKLALNQRGSEIIHLKVLESPDSPYGVPRWITQVPSVLGSRKAEELNLDYFDSGGIPPVLVFLMGGALTPEVRKQLENIFNASPKNTNRGAVVEVDSTGGTIDKENRPDVKVETFGSEAQSDSMFRKYDDDCEKKIRKAFRLPPLFVGRTDDYNYASAYASYLVAEAQVFHPERVVFDEMFNSTIMREFDPSGRYKIRSVPISIKAVADILKGVEIVKGQPGVSVGSIVNVVNEACGTALEYDESLEQEDRNRPVEVAKALSGNEDSELVNLAKEYAMAHGFIEGEADRGKVLEKVRRLSERQSAVFETLLTPYLFPQSKSPEDEVDICSCLVSQDK